MAQKHTPTQRQTPGFDSDFCATLTPLSFPPSPTLRADEVDDDTVDTFLPPFANAENKALDAEIRVRTNPPPGSKPPTIIITTTTTTI